MNLDTAIENFQEKSDEDREADFMAIFGSILARINESRDEKDRITVLDREVGKACSDYVNTYKDTVIFLD